MAQSASDKVSIFDFVMGLASHLVVGPGSVTVDPSSRRAVPDRGSKPKRNQTVKDSKVKTVNLIHNLHMRGRSITIRTIHENVYKVFVSVYAIIIIETNTTYGIYRTSGRGSSPCLVSTETLMCGRDLNCYDWLKTNCSPVIMSASAMFKFKLTSNFLLLISTLFRVPTQVLQSLIKPYI